MTRENSFFGSFILFLLISVVLTTKAQVPKDYSVATWYGFKTAAVTYTFDDNTTKQLPVAMPLFDQYNFKMTFFTVTSWSPNWTALKKASENGHEVGSHTVSHPVLNTLSIEEQDKELEQSLKAINSNITNTKCVSIAYPNCILGNLAELKKYYMVGRICSGSIVSSSPADFFNISSIVCGTQGSIKLAQDFNTKVSGAKSTKGWCVFLIHGIDDDGGWSPVQSTELASHLSFMNDNQKDYWIGTFGDVAKYIRERNSVSLTETAITADSLLISVKDTMDNSIFDVPLTIRRVLPSGWVNAKVYANGKTANYSVTTINSQNYVVFDVIPDQEEISIVKSEEIMSSVSPENNMNPFLIGPNPFSQQFRITTNGVYSYSIHSLDGKLVEKGTCDSTIATGQSLKRGVYLLILKNARECFRTKIIKS